MTSDYTYMVCTRCMTFNHHAYIEDAMNGFCMQQTNFPFVCVIVDDASTDGEQEVIKKYFDTHFDLSETGETDDYVMTYGQHKTNENCYFAVLYLKYNHYSIKKDKVPYYAKWQDSCKYIAICEGDDYWIAADKLQKQVDFLEKNDDYSMVFHTAIQHWEDNYKQDEKFSNLEDRDYSAKEIFRKWIIPTASVLFHRKYIQTKFYHNILKDKRLIYGDTPLFLTLCKEGKIFGMNNTFSVYRRHEGGMVYKYGLDKICKQVKHDNALAEFFPGIQKSYIARAKSVAYFCAVSMILKQINLAKQFFLYFPITNLFFVPLFYIRNITKKRELEKKYILN